MSIGTHDLSTQNEGIKNYYKDLDLYFAEKEKCI